MPTDLARGHQNIGWPKGHALAVPGSLAAVYLQVSVPPEAMTKESLLRLACKLRSDFAREQRLHVWIFTDERIAKKFAFDRTSPTYREDLTSLRAAYWIDRQKGEEWVKFSSDPQKSEDMERIDLSPASSQQ